MIEESHRSPSGVLKDIRILDFSWVLAGPYATRLLADFGAEVIKVHPLMPEAEDAYSRGYYNTWNRNKLSITLNLGRLEGLEIARKIIKLSDVVVENFSPRVMANWGLEYAALQKLKPDIILLSMSMMGNSGPQRDNSGYGPAVQAFSGITHLTAYPGGPPLGIGYAYADHVAALYGSLALLGALEYRRKTGEGQFIDLSQTETMVSLLSDAILEYTLRGHEPGPTGNGSSTAAPCGVYPCLGADRWCAISVTSEVQWAGFKRALGNPPWADEVKFTTISGRLQNVEALDSLVQAWTQKHTATVVMDLLQKEGVPAGFVQDAAALAADPQLRARGFFLDFPGSSPGTPFTDASPVRLSDTPAEYRRPAPEPGQDNDYVYRQILGMLPDEINNLRKKHII
jgi:benzylsuccinate CoA-transferase BbsF subunit